MTLIDSFGVCKVRASMDTLPRSSKKREGPEVPRLTSKIKEEEIWMITPTRKFSNRLVSVQSSEYAMPIRLKASGSLYLPWKNQWIHQIHKKIFRRSSFHKQFVLLGLILVLVFLLLKLSFKRDFFPKQDLNVSCS